MDTGDEDTVSDLLGYDTPEDNATAEEDLNLAQNGLQSSITMQFERASGSEEGASAEPIDKKKLMSLTAESLTTEGFLRPVQQTIQFDGTEAMTSVGIYGNNVVVCPNYDAQTVKDTGSSKVQVSQVSKFDWEQKYYFGNLVVSNQSYLAYVVKVKTVQDDKVRVLNHHTSAKALLKGFKGSVIDLAFDTMNKNLLACADCYGNVYLYLIQEGDVDLKFSLVQSISREASLAPSNHCCLSWIPTFQDSSDTELLLASSYETSCAVFDLSKMLLVYRSAPVELDSTTEGSQRINDGHTKAITKLSISPDGAVLATSALDGHVKFWELNINGNEEKRCLHDWVPHNGEPVTSLFFCDNYCSSPSLNENPSWRFVISGAKFNAEIKIWCAVRWTCLQTIQFDVGYTPFEGIPAPCVKPMLDRSAGFFVCTDIRRQVLYVFQLYQDSEEGKAHFTSLSEFMLAQSMLSFSINDAKTGKAKKDSKNEDHDVMDENGIEEEDNDNSLESHEFQATPRDDKDLLVSLKIFAVHTKALQKLSIKFNPECSVYPEAPSCSMRASTEDQLSIQDRMSDVSGLDGQGAQMNDTEELDGGSQSIDLLTDDKFERALKSPPGIHDISTKSGSNSLTAVSTLSDTSVLDSVSRGKLINGGISTQLSESCQSGSEHEEENDREEVEEKRDDAEVSATQQLTILKRGEPLPQETRESLHYGSLSMSHQSYRGAGSESGSEKGSFDERDAEEGEETSHRSRSPSDLLSFDGKPRLLIEEKEGARTNSLPSLKDIQIPSVDMPLKSSIPHEMLEARDRDMHSLYEQGQRRSSEGMAMTPTKVISISPAIAESGVRVQSDEFKQIIGLLQRQHSEIQQLTEICTNLSKKVNDLQNRRGEEAADDIGHLQQGMETLQREVNSQVNKALQSHASQTNKSLEKFAKECQSTAQLREDKFHQTMSQVITSKLEKITRSEMKGILLPGVQKAVSASLDPVNSQVAQKLSVIERTLKEEIAEMLRSPDIMNAIGTSISKTMEGTIPATYREAFRTLLLPAYEKACKAMFDQINTAFQQGTSQYIQKLETHLEGRRQRQTEAQNPLVQQLQGLVESFQATADRLTGSLESNLEALMAKQIADSFDAFQQSIMLSMDKKLASTVKEALKTDMVEVLDKHREDLVKILSCSSYGGDDLAYKNAEKTVQAAIDEGNCKGAFETALTASDLRLVDLVCKNFDPSDVFGENSALSQPIILSLVQQLSVDLLNDTEMKASYLREALLALDDKDEVTAEHIPVVIGSLVQSLNKAIESPGSDRSQMKNLKFLLMVANSLLKAP